MKFTQLNTGSEAMILEKISVDKSWLIGIARNYEVFWKDLNDFGGGSIGLETPGKAERIISILEIYFSKYTTAPSWETVSVDLPVYRGNVDTYYFEFLELEADLMVESLVGD